MPDIILSLTDEGFDATAAALPDNPRAPKSDEDRVTAYYQGQVDSIVPQFTSIATKKRLAQKGVDPRAADVLKADELAALEAFADSKPKP